jgi:hypothetical protein
MPQVDLRATRVLLFAEDRLVLFRGIDPEVPDVHFRPPPVPIEVAS